MGDASKAAQVAATHHDALVRWARALARFDTEEAMEVVQQTYLEVIEGRADLLSADDPKGFLFGVARRVAASRRRRSSIWGRILRLQLTNEPTVAPFADPETDAQSNRENEAIKKAMRSLADRQRQVVSLVFSEGCTIEEAAGLMGVSIGSARTHYHRGKQKLAAILEEIGHDRQP